MNTPESPFVYLAVIPPHQPPATSIRSQSSTADRLARHVAVVFGVDVPDNPARRTWVADYERLRVNEIARGELSGIPNPTDDKALDVIATATLQKYGPDNKAALVLAGCEVLFNSVLTVFKDVMGVLGVSDDGEQVANVTLFAAWALLVADMFRAQPALTAAAMKARAVQAESFLGWRMTPTDLSLAPSERPQDLPSLIDVITDDDPDETIDTELVTITAYPSTSPRVLSVLDATLPQELNLFSSPPYGQEASSRMLVRSLIDNWCHYLLDSADQAVAWITETPNGHIADAFLPLLEPARTFVSDVLAISPFVQPLDQEAGKATGPIPFQKSVGLEQSESQKQTRRLLPSMYSTREISRLAPRSQRALLMTHMRILQVFREGSDFRSAYLESRSREDAKLIVQTASRIWGSEDPMTMMLGVHAARMKQSDLRDTPEPEEDLARLSDNLLNGVAAVHDAWRSGAIPDGIWVSFIGECSAAIRQSAAHIAQHDPQRGRALNKALLDYWDSATVETGLRGAWELAFADNDERLPATGLNTLIHNYLVMPFNSSDPKVLMKYLKFSQEKLIPLRRRVMASRKSEYPYRIALQTTVRPVYNLLTQHQLSPEDDAWVIESAHKLERWLRKTGLAQELLEKKPLDQRDPNQSDLNFLGSLARVQLSILEHPPQDRARLVQLLRNAAHTIQVAWKTYARVLQLEAGPSSVVSATPDARRFREFKDYAKRIRVVADASARALTDEINQEVAAHLNQAEDVLLAVQPKSNSSQST